MLNFSVDLDSLTRQIDKIGEDAKAAIRPAAQAAAQVYYDAVKATVPVSKHAHWFQGTTAKAATTPEAKRAASYWYESGSLKGAIYQVYSKSESNDKRATYHIAWNHKKVPYGFMVSLGTAMGAKPNDFIGKAKRNVNEMAKEAAMDTFLDRMGAVK